MTSQSIFLSTRSIIHLRASSASEYLYKSILEGQSTLLIILIGSRLRLLEGCVDDDDDDDDDEEALDALRRVFELMVFIFLTTTSSIFVYLRVFLSIGHQMALAVSSWQDVPLMGDQCVDGFPKYCSSDGLGSIVLTRCSSHGCSMRLRDCYSIYSMALAVSS
ncbi:hypothetical protein BDC45DRAFT_542209 [Circinella umbellata]|nr:hypothetical protein BDC45DRAFT_542209 [Circinella umbellata]